MSEQTAWLPEKRVRAATTWWTRTGWRRWLLGAIGYGWTLVKAEELCPCSALGECDEGEECMCEDLYYCVPVPHTPMGSG